jgi:hypothetical protein
MRLAGSSTGSGDICLGVNHGKQISRITGELPFPQKSDPMIALPDE